MQPFVGYCQILTDIDLPDIADYRYCHSAQPLMRRLINWAQPDCNLFHHHKSGQKHKSHQIAKAGFHFFHCMGG